MALIVGTVVGAGIFRTPSLVAAHVSSEGAVILAWLAGGAVSLVGALCWAELAATYPNAGGDYHYLARAFGARLAFLFAWARIMVIQTGSMAILAFVVGDYASTILPLGPLSPALYAGIIVVALTGLNAIGVREGARAQKALAAAEVLGLLLIVGAGLTMAAPEAGGAGDAGRAVSPAGFGLVMVFVLLTYGGWNEAAYVSAEIHGSRRNIVRALVWSILLITGLYLLINLALVRGLGLAGMAQSRAVAADLMARSTGSRRRPARERAHRGGRGDVAQRHGVHGGPDRLCARARLPAPRLPRALARPHRHAPERPPGARGDRARARRAGRRHAQRVRDHGRLHGARVLALLPAHRESRCSSSGAGSPTSPGRSGFPSTR